MDENKTVWDKFLDFGKGWGLIITLIGAGVSGGVIVQTRIFDNSEQKHGVVKNYKEGLTPEQKQRAYFMDSLDKSSAIKTRAIRIKEARKNDSAKAIKDSIILDYIQKNAEQIYQMKHQLNSINSLRHYEKLN